MNKKVSLVTLACLTISLTASAQGEKIIYPKTKKVDQKDNYFGTLVADPYRWLEDDNAPETAEWVKAQNEVTFSYLSKLPYRKEMKERLKEIWNYPKYGAPFKKGDYYFFYKNDGVQNQSVLYIQESLTAEPRVLIDPNKFSADGTSSLAGFYVSKDAKHAAYGVSKAGSDWKEYFVIDLKTGEKTKDNLKFIKFSGIAWEGNGFYYTRYDLKDEKNMFSQKNEFAKVYYHKLGDSQDKDVLIHENKEMAQRSYYAGVTEDEKILYLSETESTSGNALYYRETAKKGNFIKLADGFNFDYSVLDHQDGKLIVMTNDNAPKYRVVAIDLKNPSKDKWVNLIAEQQDVMQDVSISGGKMVVTYLKDVTGRMKVYSMNGKFEKDIELPGLGVVSGFSGTKKDNLGFYTFTSFSHPPTIYKHDLASGKSEVFKKTELKIKTDDYVTTQVFYPSKDGTKIPMFLVHKKGIELNGNNPVFLYGYGGFNISVTPSFSVSNTLFIDNGGIYAVANIRGGGEYGKDWHKAGTQLQKQNVFDDFISAAEFLIEKKYTNPGKIAISGRSNGGLLVGAVMTQRPDLFKVALPGVGVLDMLRYHTFTIGYAWATDYGRSDDEKHFKNLIQYSPLHNVKEKAYPATMVFTADHDDRVVPAHSFKFISELQDKHKGENPVLIRIDVNAGHGAGKPISMLIDEYGDMWAFVFYHLGMNFK
jgi:prolyl oligopeptidase